MNKNKISVKSCNKMSSSEVALVTLFCNSHEFKTEGNS